MTTPLVRDIMSSPLISIPPTMRLPEIHHIMCEHAIRHLPVVDRERLVGSISLGEIRSACQPVMAALSIYDLSALLDKVLAMDIMCLDVVTVEAQAPLVEAAQRMLRHRCDSLPVVEDGRLVGMITRSDIMHALVAGHLLTMNPATSALPTHARGIEAVLDVSLNVLLHH